MTGADTMKYDDLPTAQDRMITAWPTSFWRTWPSKKPSSGGCILSPSPRRWSLTRSSGHRFWGGDVPGRRHRPSRSLTSDERRELTEVRRKNRVLEVEVEALKRASAYFARENILPT